MKAIVACLAACGIVLPALVEVDPARAQDTTHGSIAVGLDAYGEFVAYGFAWNYIAKDEAIAAALNACRAGGGTNCVKRVWFQNGCGALVLDQYGGGQARSAMTQAQAEARALQLCEANGGSGCTVVGSQCASSGGKASRWSGSERVHAAIESDADNQRAEAQKKAVGAREESLSREQRSQVQRGLVALGFDPGPADGLFGPKTRAAIWDWQSAKGLEASGYLTREEAEALGAISQKTEASEAHQRYDKTLKGLDEILATSSGVKDQGWKSESGDYEARIEALDRRRAEYEAELREQAAAVPPAQERETADSPARETGVRTDYEIELANENVLNPDSEGCWVAGKHCVEGKSHDDSRYLQLMYKNVCDHRISAKAFVELNNPNVKHYEYLWGGVWPGRTMRRDIRWDYEPSGKHSIEFVGSVNPDNDERCWAKRIEETAEQPPRHEPEAAEVRMEANTREAMEPDDDRCRITCRQGSICVEYTLDDPSECTEFSAQCKSSPGVTFERGHTCSPGLACRQRAPRRVSSTYDPSISSGRFEEFCIANRGEIVRN